MKRLDEGNVDVKTVQWAVVGELIMSCLVAAGLSISE